MMIILLILPCVLLIAQTNGATLSDLHRHRYKNNDGGTLSPQKPYTMNGGQLYTSLQTPTGNAVKPIPEGQPWNMFQGRTIPSDPVRDYRNFYKKYTLAYNDGDNWPVSQGIPILGSAAAADSALLAVRETVVNMLKTSSKYQHKLLAAMVNAHGRVTVKAASESWNVHPEVPDNIEAGGASLSEPSTGISEEGLCFPGNGHYRHRHELVEEFGHSIQEMAIISVDSTNYHRINKAMKVACERGVWDHAGAKKVPWDEQTEQDEYFAAGVEFIYGDNPINPFHKAQTKQSLHDIDPALFCLVTRFYDSSNTWSPSTACGGKGVSSLVSSVNCDEVFKSLDTAIPQCASANGIMPNILLLLSIIVLSTIIVMII